MAKNDVFRNKKRISNQMFFTKCIIFMSNFWPLLLIINYMLFYTYFLKMFIV